MTAVDLNKYLAEIARDDVSAKDFRTLRASSHALWRINASKATTKKERGTELAAAAKEISTALFNTPAVVRKSYIHPQIIERFEKGKLALRQSGTSRRGYRQSEMLLLTFLKASAK